MSRLRYFIASILFLFVIKAKCQQSDDCKTLFNSNIELSRTLDNSECITITASNNVDILNGFDSNNSDFFEAIIGNYNSITVPEDIKDLNCTTFRLRNNSNSKTLKVNYIICDNTTVEINLNPKGVTDCFKGNPYKTTVISDNNSNNLEIYIGCDSGGEPPLVINPPVQPPVVEPPVVQPPVVQPPVVQPPVVQPPVANAECEDFSNHSKVNPHLGARTSTNEFFGQTYAKSTPEYKVEGQTDWKKCFLIENTGKTYNYYGILEPYQGVERNIWLRTREGCKEYPDIRNQKPYTNLLRDWVGLPSLPKQNKNNEDILLAISTDIEGGELWNNNLPVWAIFSPSLKYQNLKRRINGKNIFKFKQIKGLAFTNDPDPDLLTSADEFVPKDFILDITNDDWNSSQRFVVHRSYFGGHYSTICTLTRHDGRVFVSSEVISQEINQVLIDKNSGEKFYSNGVLKGLFDLGIKGDGDYNFELRTQQGFLIESDVLIRVKRME